MSTKLRVLVVDDSALMRKLIPQILARDSEIEVVGTAMDDHLVATDLVSGASILGDGTVVLILNLSSVVAKLGKLQMVGATA